MRQVRTDPLVTCPIVCGGYMRASGYFFAGGTGKYLITARHNVLPTSSRDVHCGEMNINYQSNEYLPIVDVYLRKSDGFDIKRFDIEETDGVKQVPEVDVIGIPIDFDPAEYGYHVWRADEIVSPSSADEDLEIIGFDRKAFPADEGEYDQGMYRREIGGPVKLRVINEIEDKIDTSRKGVMASAIDEDFVGSSTEYNGLSGAPILGNGLVGIHCCCIPAPPSVVDKFGEFNLLVYTRAGILPKFLE